MTAWRFGKMPTTSVRRRISLLSRSWGLLERIFGQCSVGKALKARMSSAASEQIDGDVGEPGLGELVDDVAELGSRWCLGRAVRRSSGPGWRSSARWSSAHREARLAMKCVRHRLPGGLGEHQGDGRLDAPVGVGDDQLHAREPPGDERAQELVQAAVSSVVTMSKPTISRCPRR